MVIVDVLSFTTSVGIAVDRGATVLPYPASAEDAESYASEHSAQIAARRSTEPGVLSLSPTSLMQTPTGIRLVLPSPNGSALSFQAAEYGAKVIAGCLRNASAVAALASANGGSVNVIPAGERWPDRSLRPAFEDLIGAGAIISQLSGQCSPEARAAVAAFEDAKPHLLEQLLECSSGLELVERGFQRDVELASQLDTSKVVPVLTENAYQPG